MAKKHFLIGIAGKIGSGKSTVAKVLCDDYGFSMIDADKVGHAVLEELKPKIIEEFGKDIINDKNKIDRALLGNLVFSDPDKLKQLNSLLHPEMKKKIIRMINDINTKLIALDAALLFEIKLDEICDYILAVEAPADKLVERIKKYRNWPEEKILKVLKIQDDFNRHKQDIDYIIFNNADEEKLRKQIEFFILAVL